MEKPVQSGDIELWVVSHDDWSLPVSAIPVTMNGKDYFACSDIIGFNAAQFDAVHAKLSPAAAGTDGTFTFIPRLAMPAVASKAPGISPRYYIRWNGQSSVKPKLEFGMDEQLETPEPTDSTREFIDHIAWKARAMSREDILFLWTLITQEMPAWLTEKRKPISFGYFTIWALPYRANWKQILLAKFPGIAAAMRMPKRERYSKLSMSDFEQHLQHTDLISYYTNSKTVGWSVECTPTKYWADFIQDAESKKRKRLGATNYGKAWSRLVWSLRNTIIDVFASFTAQTTIPCAEPIRCDRYGGYSLGPCIPANKIAPVGLDAVDTYSVNRDASRTVVCRGTPKSLAPMAETNACVPALHPIQFAEEDVRDGGRVLPADGEREA